MSKHRFILDGYERAVAAAEPRIRAEVSAERSEELQAAGFFRRVILQWQMRREISRRVERQAPIDGLY